MLSKGFTSAHFIKGNKMLVPDKKKKKKVMQNILAVLSTLEKLIVNRRTEILVRKPFNPY